MTVTHHRKVLTLTHQTEAQPLEGGDNPCFGRVDGELGRHTTTRASVTYASSTGVSTSSASGPNVST